MGHGGRVEEQDVKAVNGVGVTDSRGNSAKDVGDTILLGSLLCRLLWSKVL